MLSRLVLSSLTVELLESDYQSNGSHGGIMVSTFALDSDNLSSNPSAADFAFFYKRSRGWDGSVLRDQKTKSYTHPPTYKVPK